MTPFYEDGRGIQLYNADAREALPQLPMVDHYKQMSAKKQTSKSIVMASWKTSTERVRMSSVLKAIGRALAAMPDKENSWDASDAMRKFCKRICDGDYQCMGGPYALKYQCNWTGEWTITNSDLHIWSYVDMWVSRAPVETMAPQIISPITLALSLKRKQQAYDRYKSSGLTKEHCALIEHLQWDMDMMRGDWISLFSEGKRPFGNTGAYTDVYEHAGWTMDWGDDGPSDDQKERAWNLFDELVFAMPDAGRLAAKSIRKKD